MSSLPTSPIWTTGTTEVVHTGTWRSKIPHYFNPPSPCHNSCPLDGNIAVWIQQVRQKDYYDAWVTLTNNNPIPAVIGRICHHPCETACNRVQYDEPIAICDLERFVGDMALTEGWSFPSVPHSKDKKIAIVGGGPTGLAAAFHLRRKGYQVTIFESQPELGGLLRYGIPSYRLSKDILDKEIQRILELGVEVKTNASVTSRQDYEKLQEEFDAIYLAMGAGIPKHVPALDYSQAWLIDSVDYLEKTNAGEVPDLGDRIVVIGGGSAAMDVARTARRHGKQISILSLETEQVMPAQREEVVEAKEEAIRLIDGSILQSVEDNGDQGLGLNCIKVKFEAGSERGQFSVEPIAGTEFTLEADTIVSAIGQDPDLSVLHEFLELNGALVQVDRQQQSSLKGVFAGGDIASMERFVSHALGMGMHAAKQIDHYLQGKLPEDGEAIDKTVDMEVINTYYYDKSPREKQEIVPVEDRLNNFDEVQLELSQQEALVETQRCFSCGNCIFCDNCYYYCPDMAVVKLERGYSIRTDYCKGCGLCVKECPTGSIAMRDE